MKIFSLLLIICLTLASNVTLAQSIGVSPVHGWLIGKSSPSSSVNNKCILFNQFSDGTLLRFTLDGNSIEAFTVIYRDNIFRPDLTNNYETTLALSSDYTEVLEGYAYDSNILNITLPNEKIFYDALKRNTRMTITVPGTRKIFNLYGLSNQLTSVDCGIETAAPPAQPVNTQDVKEIRIHADLTLPKRNSIITQGTWRAAKGERMSAVIERWSSQAGKTIRWNANLNPVIQKDFVFQGRHEDALEKLFELVS